ncbi:hypothetical protein [Brevibacillus agri]|uniref:hypothetical protein n=1 Tax=Brevibacillus agri TaxID=51101 RepID=UPI003D2090AE
MKRPFAVAFGEGEAKAKSLKSPSVVAFGEARKDEKSLELLGIPAGGWTARLRGKSKTASKVVDSGCVSEWTLKSVFCFFPSTSVGIPKSFRGFLLFPRQRLAWVGLGFLKRL